MSSSAPLNLNVVTDAKVNNISASSSQLPIILTANLQLVPGNICIDSITHNLVVTDGVNKYTFAHL